MTKRQEWEAMIKEVSSLPDSYIKRSMLVFLEKYKPKPYESRKKLPCTCGNKRPTVWWHTKDRVWFIRCENCNKEAPGDKREIRVIENWNEMIKNEIASKTTD